MKKNNLFQKNILSSENAEHTSSFNKLKKGWLTIVATFLFAIVSIPAHACAIPKSYYKHVSCTSNSRYFLAVKDSGAPVALINKKGKRAVDLSRYSQVDANKLKNGLIPVQRNGRVGYVNMSGKEVVPAIYDPILNDSNTQGWARAVSNNRIIVKKKSGFGIITPNNSVILPFSSSYLTITDFSAGKAKIVKGNETFWVDVNARRTASPNQQSTASASSVPTNHSSTLQTNQNQGYSNDKATINQKSNIIAGREIWLAEKRDGKWGFINGAGVPMITFSFEKVTPFSEGLAGVRLADKWGFVNLAGELVIPFRFDESGIDWNENGTRKPFVFKDGKAWVGSLNNGSKICVNIKGDDAKCESQSQPSVSTSLKPYKPST